MTRSGPLDVLGSIAGGGGYQDLAPRARSLDAGDGLIVSVLDLEALIESKAAAGRPKDLAALPLWRAVLDERRRSGAD